MNQLKMDIQQTIGTLSRGGWSQRRISRELGIDRETVARYRRLARQAEAPKPAIPPTGSEPVQTPNPAIVPPGPEVTTKSGQVRPTRLWDRWSGHGGDVCSFGFCLRPAMPQTANVPFAGWEYRPSYLPEPHCIHVASNVDVLTEPMLCYLAFARRSDAYPSSRRQPLEHAAGLRAMTPPLGADVTVAYGFKDLRVLNPYLFPVCFRAIPTH